MVECNNCGELVPATFAYIDSQTQEVTCDVCNGAVENLLSKPARKVNVVIVGSNRRLYVNSSQQLAPASD